MIVAGRLLDKQVILVNIYAPNFDDSNFFSRVFTSIPISDDYALIIGGDFNCVLDTSLDRSSSKVIQPSKAAINIKNVCDQFGLLDPWRFIFPSSRTFSFFSPVHHSYSRIDFFLVDKSLIPLVSSSMDHSIVISDHAPSSFVLSLPTQHSSFKPWRLNSLLLADEEFITYLTNEINIYLELNDTHDVSRSILWEALKAYLHGKIISFSSYVKRQELSRLRDISEAINKLDEQYAISPCPRLYKERISLQSEYNLLSTSQEEKRLLKTQHTFYEFGDKASKLLAFQSRQLNNLKTITNIKAPSGSMAYFLQDINESFVHFYSTLYTSEYPNDPAILDTSF